jgi:hypothetical protein
MPNQTPPELKVRMVAMTRDYPTTSYAKIADQLKLIGVPATANQVRGIWLRKGLVKACNRLLWLEREVAATAGPLTQRNTKVHSPRTNDFCERFQRTLKQRSHQGHRTQGRTLRQAFRDGLAVISQPQTA